MDYKDTTLKFIILCIYYNITYFNVYTLNLYAIIGTLKKCKFIKSNGKYESILCNILYEYVINMVLMLYVFA